MDEMKLKLEKMQEYCMQINEGSLCRICRTPVLSRDFFAFPCSHYLHKSCATDFIQRKQLGSQEQLQLVSTLLENIEYVENVIDGDMRELVPTIVVYSNVVNPTAENQSNSQAMAGTNNYEERQ